MDFLVKVKDVAAPLVFSKVVKVKLLRGEAENGIVN